MTYNYSPNTNKLASISNSVSGGASSSYTYDSNGNVISDSKDSITFVIYDIDNLPVAAYTTNGQQQVYWYSVDGERIRKSADGSDTYYVNSPDGNTELIQEGEYNGTYTYNLWGEDNVGQIKDNSGSLSRYYYLKNHFPSKVFICRDGARRS